MKEKGNPILSFLRETPADNNQIHLLHDSAGRITDVLHEKTSRHAAIIRELKETGTLADYYDFLNPPKKTRPLHRIAARHFRNTPFFQKMYSLLPMSALLSTAVEHGLFLGRIVFYALEPNVSSPSLFGVLYLEPGSERLLAFNDYVYDRLSGRKDPPESYLGRPLSAVLSPTPAEFQAMHLPEGDPEAGGGWKNAPGRFEIVPEEMEPGHGTKPFVLENTLDETVFLTMLGSVDTRASDFIFTVELERLGGDAPFFTVGTRAGTPGETPDEHGYLLGSSGVGEELVLKRIGLLTQAAAAALSAGERLKIRLCKTGHSIALCIGPRCVLAFYDPDFKHHEKTYVSMGVRPGGRVRVRSVSLRTRAVRAQNSEVPAKHIVQIAGQSRAFYALDRFFNYFIGHTEYARTGQYLLYDVTELEGRVRALTGRVEDQRRREAALKSLLREYRTGATGPAGSGRAMRELLSAAQALSAAAAPVLIEGPTGAGKEVVARYIHEKSTRRQKPFVRVDCATVPPGLIESHLFGHEKGAFTGAVARQVGVFEKAHGGTLFLDEVGNLTPAVQAKLLQFFNDFTISRIGSEQSIKVDVRCLTATNADLQEKVRQGEFREDLFFRINVLNLKVPALKERLEDIPELCDHFIREINLAEGKNITGFAPEALARLAAHAWPGNVRELRNVIQRAAVFCAGDRITAEMIHLAGPEGGPAARRRGRGRFLFTAPEKVKDALRRCHGVVVDAAGSLGVSKVALYAYLKRHGIRPDDFRA